jgi:hypothetical protein
VAEALGSRGAEELRNGDAAAALGLIERGVALAPNPPVLDRRCARLDLAQAELELLLAHPEVDPKGERFEAQKDLLLFGADENAAAGVEARRSYHTAAGRLLAARGAWTGAGVDNAAYHLRLAIDLQRELDRAAGLEPANPHPLPELSMVLGAGLRTSGDPAGALEAYLDACEGYLAQGMRPEAEEALRLAKEIAAQLGGSQRALEVEAMLRGFRAPTIEPVPVAPAPLEAAPAEEPSHSDGLFTRVFAFDGQPFSTPTRAGAFAPSSWYAGGSLGGSWLVTSEGSVEDDLDEFGDVGVNIDDAQLAYKFYAGYRFSLPVALELGYTDLGQIESTVGPEPPPPLDDFLDELSDDHPAPGRGVTLALRGLLYGNDHVALNARLGVWYWSSDVEVHTTSAEVDIHRDGVDLLYGLDFAWQPLEWGALRLDLERYYSDDDPSTLATLGVEFQLDRIFD